MVFSKNLWLKIFAFSESEYANTLNLPSGRGGGLRDAWNAAHYRGISIVDTTGKFLERLVYFRLKIVCEERIHENQSGGLARNGSVQQIIRAVTAVEENINHTDWDERGREYRDNHVIMALLDCSNAFDRMNRSVLLQKLWDMGVRDRLFVFLVAYFCDRQQRVRVGDSVSTFCRTWNGGTQGSVIVLFVWLIYINDISARISECDFGLFVDDVILWLSSPNDSSVLDRLNSDLNRIYGWQIFNAMIFDFSKFNVLDVGVPLHKNLHTRVTFGEGNPPWCSEAVYLGVLIDRKFSFIPFLNRINERVQRTSWRVTNHANAVRGASPRTLEIIFYTFIFPIIVFILITLFVVLTPQFGLS